MTEPTAAEPVVEYPTLASPAEPVPDVVDTPEAFEASIAALSAGTGPLAVDAERAQGFRYSSRAYLIQLKRTGSGIHLIDPVAFRDGDAEADLSALGEALQDTEWIIHAASQDTPCLAQVGMLPPTLFDTELAGRLLGLPKVGLGAMIERYFELHLMKEHSAADWSSRPLPDDWLNYAALDVELLVELRDKLAAELEDAGKSEWARQEFAHLANKATRPPVPRQDPWRRTSGIHQVRTPMGMAIVRELWQARDEIAQRLDKAPGKILQDKAIAELAAHTKPGRNELRSIQGFQRRTAKRYETTWLDALGRAQALTRSQLPKVHLPPDGPPPPRTWENKSPEAHDRYLRMREVVNGLADELHLPAENLITPDCWRRLAWLPPAQFTEEAVDSFFADLEVRQWQREIVVGPLTAALAATDD